MSSDFFVFICNICGCTNIARKSSAHRELLSCRSCSSNARFRGIIHVLSLKLFKTSLCLRDFPNSIKDKTAIGMSDSPVYAVPLSSKMNYTNTFYDKSPFLDISDTENWKEFQNLDFIISTDVFEHIPLRNLARSFENMFRMLKPGGFLIFSVPYAKIDQNIEHFPDLNVYEIYNFFDRKILVNQDSSARLSVYDNLIFHGGEGATLEMRMFSEKSIIELACTSGFKSFSVYPAEVLDVGYFWKPLSESIKSIGHPVLGYVMLFEKSTEVM